LNDARESEKKRENEMICSREERIYALSDQTWCWGIVVEKQYKIDYVLKCCSY
jgi:hypothetical protein